MDVGDTVDVGVTVTEENGVEELTTVEVGSGVGGIVGDGSCNCDELEEASEATWVDVGLSISLVSCEDSLRNSWTISPSSIRPLKLKSYFPISDNSSSEFMSRENLTTSFMSKRPFPFKSSKRPSPSTSNGTNAKSSSVGAVVGNSRNC